MASPAVATRSATDFTSSSTTHNVTMPATVNAGDLLLAFFFFSGSSTPSVSGWTLIETRLLFDSSNQSIAVFGKDAVGNEDSTTVNFATSSSSFAVVLLYRMTGWSGTLADLTAVSASGGSGSANPPNADPGDGSLDYLVLAMGANTGSATITAAPTNYTNLLQAATFDFAASAERQLTASSENPGTFSHSSDAWGAWTVMVPPEATAHQATASTSVSVTGSATGEKTGKATAASSIQVTGAATAKAHRKATATASVAISTTATGNAQPQKATAASSVTITCSAAGRAIRRSTASTAVTVTGSATGSRPPRQATGTTNITVVCLAEAKRVAKGTAACTFTVSTTALGWRPRTHPTNPSTAPLTFTPGRVSDPPVQASTTLAESKATATASDTSGTATPTNEPGKAE